MMRKRERMNTLERMVLWLLVLFLFYDAFSLQDKIRRDRNKTNVLLWNIIDEKDALQWSRIKRIEARLRKIDDQQPHTLSAR